MTRTSGIGALRRLPLGRTNPRQGTETSSGSRQPMPSARRLWGERILVRGLKHYVDVASDVSIDVHGFGANESSSGD